MHLERFLKRSYDHTEPTFCGMQALFSVAYAKQQMVELIGSRLVFVGFALRVGEPGLGVSETTWGVSRFAFS